MDEFSAVSRRLPIWALYERARSLGLAVQVSAQSWHGLAPDEADRYRIVSAAEGGIWLLRTPHPEPVTELAGPAAGGGHDPAADRVPALEPGGQLARSARRRWPTRP